MSIFTRILAGELPGHFVWKDEYCFSIMTIQPIREGHLLVIPNQEVDHWDDVPPAQMAHIMGVAQHLAKAIKAVIPCRRVGVSIVGLEVPHTHVHLMPIDQMGDMNFAASAPVAPEALAKTAAQLREVLIAAGHSEAGVDLSH